MIFVISFLVLPIYPISYGERCTTITACKMITVFIDEVRQIQNPDDIFGGDGDYYATVKIGRDALQSFSGAALSIDDGLDINPRDGIQEIILNFNMDDGTWTGRGLAFMVSDVRGDGDVGNLQQFLFEGGQAARILFDVIIEPFRPRGGETVLNPIPAPLASCQ